MKKSIILLSAGLDSAVNCYEAKQQSEPILAVTFDYGQRAAAREIEYASRICGDLHIPHATVHLAWFKEIAKSTLVDTSRLLPSVDPEDLADEDKNRSRARQVWVPNRNGVFINIAAAYAEGLEANQVVAGFNAEEAASFPDNSEMFISAVNKSLAFSTLNKIQAVSYTARMRKVEIVRRALELEVNFQNVWSCYDGGDTMCGRCESCVRLIQALGASAPRLLPRIFPGRRPS